jgi:uncharacterized lipoprotein
MKMYATVLAVLAMTVIAGCSERQEPGQAEKAGKQIDQAMEKAGQQTQATLEKAEDYTSKKLKEAGQAIERAGEELKK